MIREAPTSPLAGRGVVTLHPPPESGLPDREVGVAHVQRWPVLTEPMVPEAVKALAECHPALRGRGLLAPSWLAVHELGAGHGLHLLAELSKYARRATDHTGNGCILFSSSLVAPGFDSAQALRVWRSSRLRALPGIVVGDRCAAWLPRVETE